MNPKKIINNFLNSLKVSEDFFYTIAVDIIFILIIVGLFAGSGYIIQSQSDAITQGKDPTSLKQEILSASPEKSEQIKSQMKNLVITLITLLLIVPILAFLLFSLSRNIIWNIIQDKEFSFKKSLRWNLLNLPIVLLIWSAFIITSLILSTIMSFIFSFMGTIPSNVARGITSMIILITGIMVTLLTYQNYAKTNKVWKSIGNAFKKIKSNYTNTLVTIITASIFLIILQLIIALFKLPNIPLPNWLFIYPTLNTIITTLMFLIWIGWFRQYLTKHF